MIPFNNDGEIVSGILTVEAVGITLHRGDYTHLKVSTQCCVAPLRELFAALDFVAQPGVPFAVLEITPTGVVNTPDAERYHVYEIVIMQPPTGQQVNWLLYDTTLHSLTLFGDRNVALRLHALGDHRRYAAPPLRPR